MNIEKGLRAGGIIVLGTLLLGFVLACSLFNQPPTARFTVSVLAGDSPLTVSFDATSSEDPEGDIDLYVWNFGDGQVGLGSTVQHTFTTTQLVEVFTVTLTVTDEDGASSESTQSIEVHSDGEGPVVTGNPVASFTVDQFIGADPLRVAFDASASLAGTGSITAYNWNFGDGIEGTGMTVTHTYFPEPEVTTTYPATLFVWNSAGQLATAQINIIVIVPEGDTGDDPPEADVFVTGPDILYESPPGDRPGIPSLFEVKFDPRGSFADAGHSILYYSWDFGDGNRKLETSDLEVTHIYSLGAQTRTYVASLTVYDDQGLQDTFNINVTLIQPEEDDE